jgi:alkylated DNA repair dioxygenase AlkB
VGWHAFFSCSGMETLFPIEPVTPSGFQYFPDFLSRAEEDILLEALPSIPLHTFMFQGYEAKRKVASFGYDWNFETRKLSKGKDIPTVFDPLMQKVSSFLKIPLPDFAEVLLTEYPAGSVINWHRDAPPFDIIVGISLLSDCVFRFRPHDKEKQHRSAVISLPLKRGSLYVMKGEARAEWQHSIMPVKEVRYSVTLRTL